MQYQLVILFNLMLAIEEWDFPCCALEKSTLMTSSRSVHLVKKCSMVMTKSVGWYEELSLGKKISRRSTKYFPWLQLYSCKFKPNPRSKSTAGKRRRIVIKIY